MTTKLWKLGSESSAGAGQKWQQGQLRTDSLSALQNTQKIQQRAAPDTLELEVRWDENKKD